MKGADKPARPSPYLLYPRRPASLCVSWDVVEAACACLLAQGEEAEKEQCSERLAEKRVLEEFGRCLSQILHTEFKSKESNTE